MNKLRVEVTEEEFNKHLLGFSLYTETQRIDGFAGSFSRVFFVSQDTEEALGVVELIHRTNNDQIYPMVHRPPQVHERHFYVYK